MDNQAPILLTDEQMRQFIVQGFLILHTDFPEPFHMNLNEQLREVYEKEGNPGNNLLPRIRELRKVFEHPVITGALTSVLGANYLMHAHRHGHYNALPTAGHWHKDSYWGYRRMRNHHSQWAMIMYFPQDTPLDLGPTSVIAGSQHHQKQNFSKEKSVPQEAFANGKAGTFALIHYDIWHRSTPNTLNEPRFMLKFEFMRTHAPVQPEWDCRDKVWQMPANHHPLLSEHPLLWEENWNWLCGQTGSLANIHSADADTIHRRAAELANGAEPDALNAAYQLAAGGEKGIQALLQQLQQGSEEASRSAAYGLSVAGEDAVPGLIRSLQSEREDTLMHAVFALGELADLAASAVPALRELQAHPSSKVRNGIAEALGLIGTPVDAVVAGLNTSLQDENAQVRFMAALSVAKLGPLAAGTLPDLERALEDDNRYVRAHATEALRYIGTPEAQKILLDELLNSRWCSTTNASNAFYP